MQSVITVGVSDEWATMITSEATRIRTVLEEISAEESVARIDDVATFLACCNHTLSPAKHWDALARSIKPINEILLEIMSDTRPEAISPYASITSSIAALDADSQTSFWAGLRAILGRHRKALQRPRTRLSKEMFSRTPRPEDSSWSLLITLLRTKLEWHHRSVMGEWTDGADRNPLLHYWEDNPLLHIICLKGIPAELERILLDTPIAGAGTTLRPYWDQVTIPDVLYEKPKDLLVEGEPSDRFIGTLNTALNTVSTPESPLKTRERAYYALIEDIHQYLHQQIGGLSTQYALEDLLGLLSTSQMAPELFIPTHEKAVYISPDWPIEVKQYLRIASESTQDEGSHILNTQMEEIKAIPCGKTKMEDAASQPKYHFNRKLCIAPDHTLLTPGVWLLEDSMLYVHVQTDGHLGAPVSVFKDQRDPSWYYRSTYANFIDLRNMRWGILSEGMPHTPSRLRLPAEYTLDERGTLTVARYFMGTPINVYTEGGSYIPSEIYTGSSTADSHQGSEEEDYTGGVPLHEQGRSLPQGYGHELYWSYGAHLNRWGIAGYTPLNKELNAHTLTWYGWCGQQSTAKATVPLPLSINNNLEVPPERNWGRTMEARVILMLEGLLNAPTMRKEMALRGETSEEAQRYDDITKAAKEMVRQRNGIIAKHLSAAFEWKYSPSNPDYYEIDAETLVGKLADQQVHRLHLVTDGKTKSSTNEGFLNLDEEGGPRKHRLVIPTIGGKQVTASGFQWGKKRIFISEKTVDNKYCETYFKMYP